MDERPAERKLAAILSADVEGYSRLMGEDELATVRALTESREVIGAAVAPVIVAEMSPPALRGLYQGIWGSSWGLAFFLGPALGGFVFQHFGSAALWGGMFVLGVALCFGYLALSIPARRRAQEVAAES
jgi:MFS family permease